MAAEFGFEAADAAGHEVQNGWRDVPGWAGAAGGGLYGLGQFVEGEVVGSADLERSPAGGIGSVMARSTTAATSMTETKLMGLSPWPKTRGRPERAAVCSSRSIHSSRKAEARTTVVRRPLAARVLLGGVLHAEQLHRAVRRSADGRHQHEVGAGGVGRVDEVGVAVAIDGRWRDSPRSGEAVNSRDDNVDSGGGLAKAVAVADVADDHLDLGGRKVRGALRVAGEDANVEPQPGQATDDEGAEAAGATGDEDHEGPPGGDLAPDGVIDAAAALLDGFEVEASPAGEAVNDAEDDDASHDVGRAVGAGAAVLPFAPDGVTINGVTQHLGAEVGDGGEDLRPVLANLVATDEAPLGMRRGLVAIVGCEAPDQRVEVMVVGGSAQPLDNGRRTGSSCLSPLLLRPRTQGSIQ